MNAADLDLKTLQLYAEGLRGLAGMVREESGSLMSTPAKAAEKARARLVVIQAQVASNSGIELACPTGGGCTFCCYQTVGTTVPEVLAIAGYLREHAPEKVEAVKTRCKEWMEK